MPTLQAADLLRIVKAAALPAMLETVAQLYELVRNRNGTYAKVQAVCSESRARLILPVEQFLVALPPIRVITRCPIFTEIDGKLKLITGYDKQTGILAGGEAVDDLSLDEARQFLDDLLSDFSYATGGDRARALLDGKPEVMEVLRWNPLVPAGWTPEAWHGRLRQMARICMHAHKADELRAWSDAVAAAHGLATEDVRE